MVNPSWMQVEEQLRGMNGDDRSDLILSGPENLPYLGVGGGRDGWYVASFTKDNETFDHLLEVNPVAGTIEMNFGGQPDSRNLAFCVRLETVLAASREFFESGHPSPKLRWLHEGPKKFKGRMGRGAGKR